MKQQRKNKYFTFLCSFIPGAAEMYMGFMKMGLSLMTIFCLCILAPMSLGFDEQFILLAALIWFYGFFHARNLSACEDTVFDAMEDYYIWNEFLNGKPIKIRDSTARKWSAVILIVVGGVLLWGSIRSFFYFCIPDELWYELSPLVDRFPQAVIAILIIIAGVRMILNKKAELDETVEVIYDSQKVLSENVEKPKSGEEEETVQKKAEETVQKKAEETDTIQIIR